MIETTTESSPESSSESTESIESGEQSQVVEQPKPVLRETKIDVEGRSLAINELQLKQLYGIDPNEQLTDREFKTMVSSYKAQKTADLRSKQASEQERLVKEIASMIQNNPFELLQRAGYNPRELAEKYLADAIEEDLLPESEKELKRVRSEKEQLEAQLRAEQERKENEEIQNAVSHYQQEITHTIIDALESSSLPKTPDVVRQIAKYLLLAEQKGVNISPKHVIPLVEEDLRKLNASILKSLDPQKRMGYIGEDILKQLRQDDVSRIKQPINNGGSKQIGSSQRSSEKLTKEEFRKIVRDRVKSN